MQQIVYLGGIIPDRERNRFAEVVGRAPQPIDEVLAKLAQEMHAP